MPSLSNYWDNYETYTGKASDVARQLAFAGLAVVWIFRIGEGSKSVVPRAFLPAMFAFVLTLSLDLMQYVLGSIIWFFFCRHHEKRLPRPEADPDLTGPWWIHWPITIMFIGKLVAVIIGYGILLWQLSARIIDR